jgi:hypothetical protein
MKVQTFITKIREQGYREKDGVFVKGNSRIKLIGNIAKTWTEGRNFTGGQNFSYLNLNKINSFQDDQIGYQWLENGFEPDITWNYLNDDRVYVYEGKGNWSVNHEANIINSPNHLKYEKAAKVYILRNNDTEHFFTPPEHPKPAPDPNFPNNGSDDGDGGDVGLENPFPDGSELEVPNWILDGLKKENYEVFITDPGYQSGDPNEKNNTDLIGLLKKYWWILLIIGIIIYMNKE